MDDFDKYLAVQLKNPEFKKEYDALDAEYQIISSLIRARTEKGMTQQELSRLIGITQADLSRLESGSANPSLKTLKRIARVLVKGCRSLLSELIDPLINLNFVIHGLSLVYKLQNGHKTAFPFHCKICNPGGGFCVGGHGFWG